MSAVHIKHATQSTLFCYAANGWKLLATLQGFVSADKEGTL